MKYLHHHLGLGDCFTCNPIVRYYYSLENELTIFSYRHYLSNVERMYSDLENLKIIPVSSDGEAQQYVYTNNLIHDYIRVGFEKVSNLKDTCETFDEAFYVGQNIPYEDRFKHFYIPRDMEREMNTYNELNPNNEPFIFIHEDRARGMLMNRNRIRKDLKIIENDKKYFVTDIIYLLERAAEVHLMQSAFKDMINFYKVDGKCFLHNYIRGYDSFANTKGLNNFEILY